MGGKCSVPAELLQTVDVVIIGCGYGGLQLAHDFKQAGVKFTIIEPKEYFHHCVGALRASVYSGKTFFYILLKSIFSLNKNKLRIHSASCSHLFT